MGTTIKVNAELCRKDGLCAKVCPERIYTWEPQQVPNVARADECVLCGHCLAICASNAIAHSALDSERFTPSVDLKALKPDDVLALLRQRRSVRSYRNEPIPKEILEKIVDTAAYAPASSHLGRGWEHHVTVVRGRESMKKVAELSHAYARKLVELIDGTMLRILDPWVSEVHEVRTMLLPDLHMRFEHWEQGRDVFTYDAPAAIFVHASRKCIEPQVDCDAALYTIMLAAEAYGIGTCWNGILSKGASGYKTKGFTAFREFVGIPEDHDVYAAMTLGYPALRLKRVPFRKTTVRWIGP